MTDEENDRFAKALEDIKAFVVTMDEAASCTSAAFDKLKTAMRNGEARGVVFLSTMGGKSHLAEMYRVAQERELYRIEARALMAALGKVVNPKNKPYYRQFEGGKKWKF